MISMLDEILTTKVGLQPWQLLKLRSWGYDSAPASKGHHLAVRGGLVEHSYNVSRRLEEISKALKVEWPREHSPWVVGMLHDLVKCRCYRLRQDGSGSYDYVQPEYPGHGVASVMLATVDLGFCLMPSEAAAITWHMGAFGLQGKALDEFDAALDVYPAQIIATHTADWAAARLDESGDFSDLRSKGGAK